jgi:hypothetical protein
VFLIKENETFLYYPTSKTQIQNALDTSPNPNQSSIQIESISIQKKLARHFIQPFASQYAFIQKSNDNTDYLLEPTTLFFEPKEPTNKTLNQTSEQPTQQNKLSVNVLIKGIKTAVEIEETTLPSQLKQKLMDQGLVTQTDPTKIRLIFGGMILKDTKEERNPLTNAMGVGDEMGAKPNYIVNLNGFVSGETTINVM